MNLSYWENSRAYITWSLRNVDNKQISSLYSTTIELRFDLEMNLLNFISLFWLDGDEWKKY